MRDFLEQYDDETQGENCGGETGSEADEKIAAVADADFGVLGEVVGEKQRVAFRAGQDSGQANVFFGGWSTVAASKPAGQPL